MGDRKNRICPVKLSGSLDNRLRRWIHDPRKILGHYIKEGMTVMDIGCGPGFFSVDMAEMVGRSGRVIACDLQEGMLRKIRDKIHGTELEQRITLHQCRENSIGVSEKVDFVLAFYMVHEVPDQRKFFDEIVSILRPKGKILIAEPPFHVSKNAFEETVRIAQDVGFIPIERPKIFLSKTVILQKN